MAFNMSPCVSTFKLREFFKPHPVLWSLRFFETWSEPEVKTRLRATVVNGIAFQIIWALCLTQVRPLSLPVLRGRPVSNIVNAKLAFSLWYFTIHSTTNTPWFYGTSHNILRFIPYIWSLICTRWLIWHTSSRSPQFSKKFPDKYLRLLRPGSLTLYNKKQFRHSGFITDSPVGFSNFNFCEKPEYVGGEVHRKNSEIHGIVIVHDVGPGTRTVDLLAFNPQQTWRRRQDI